MTLQEARDALRATLIGGIQSSELRREIERLIAEVIRLELAAIKA